MTLLSIDPSINYMGLAVFAGRELTQATCYKTKGKSDVERMRSLAAEVLHLIEQHGVNAVVVEIPACAGVYNGRKTTLSAIAKTWLAIGAIAGALATAPGVSLSLRKADRTPKGVRQRNMTLIYSPDLDGIAESYREHVWDAVDVGHHFISQQQVEQLELVGV